MDSNKSQKQIMQQLQDLKKSDAKLRSLFQALDDIILEFDYAGNYLSVAPTSPNLLVLPSEKILSKNISEIFSAEETKMFLKHIQAAVDTNVKQSFEYSLLLAEKVHYFRATVSPLPHRRVLYVARDITSEKAAEDSLIASHEMLDTILNNIPNGFLLIDEDYKIRKVNRRTCEITGYTEAELEGSLCNTICPKATVSNTCPILTDGKNDFWGMETTIKGKNGRVTSILKNAQSITLNGKNYLIESFQDITERKEYEEAIRNSKERFELLSKTTFEGIITHNQGRITFANDAFQKMIGFSLQEMLEQSFIDHIPYEKDRKKIHQNMVKPSTEPYLVTIECKDSKKLLVEIEGKDISFKGKKIRLVAVRDVTEREATKQELNQSNKRYQYLYDSSPISIWEEDFSAIYDFIQTKKAAGIEDFEKYFDEHPEAVRKCSQLAKILDCNQTTLDIYQAENKESFFDNLQSVFTENSFATFKQQLIAISQNLPFYEGTCTNRTFGGDLINVSVRWNVVPAYKKNYQRVLVSIVDITQRTRSQKIQQALYQISNAFTYSDNLKELAKKIQLYLKAILDTNNFYIALYNKDDDTFNMVYCADSYDEIKAFPAGKTLTAYLVKQKRSMIVNGEMQMKLQDQGLIDNIGKTSAVWMGVPLRKEQEIIGALVVQSYHDENAYNQGDKEVLEFISDQISTLLIKKKTQEELNWVQKRLEIATSMLRHDIANDLSVINSALKIYKRSDNKQLLDEMEKRIKKSLKLIQQHREQEQFIESHKNLQPYNLRELFQQIIPQYSSLDFEISGEGSIYADQGIYSVFDNLIGNAQRHGKANKIIIKINITEKHCEILFQDNGKGLDPQIIDNIFEKGFSYGSSGNTGLGLYIVKENIEHYGGRILLVKTDQAGTSFFIRLPKIQAD